MAQSLAALAADAVLEVENVVASPAGKEFHIGGISYGDVGLQAHSHAHASACPPISFEEDGWFLGYFRFLSIVWAIAGKVLPAQSFNFAFSPPLA